MRNRKPDPISGVWRVAFPAADDLIAHENSVLLSSTSAKFGCRAGSELRDQSWFRLHIAHTTEFALRVAVHVAPTCLGRLQLSIASMNVNIQATDSQSCAADLILASSPNKGFPLTSAH